MKQLITVIFLLISFLGFGQSVSAPDSKSFLQSTNGQDASGFALSGFSSTSTLLASISLVNPPVGTTFYLNSTTGLTAASGFTVAGNKTRLVVTGTMANINLALASLKVNTGSVAGSIQISVAATVNPVGFFYNGVNGHFYRPISTGATYANAKAASLLTTFKGQTGYLVTLTSADENTFIFNNVPQSNIWFACTDEVVEGRWRIDAGPEKGTLIKTQNGTIAGNIAGQYNNWAGGEPNNSGSATLSLTNLLFDYNTLDIDSYSGTGTTIRDISSNSRNGAIVGTPAYQDGYLTWNNNSHIVSSNLATTLTGDKPIHSVEVWAYPTGNGVIVQYTGQEIPNSAYHFSGIELVNGRPVFGLWGPAGLVTTGTSANVITLNQWHHFVMTYDGTAVRGYVNGSLVATISSVNFETPLEFNRPVFNFVFGAPAVTNHGDGTAFDGRFRAMRVYNKTLTPQEIFANYSSITSTAGEDYPVTKWGGQPTWNDLPGDAQWVNPYVIEYGTWTNPDDATFTEFQTNSVTHSTGDVLRASFSIDFGNNVDETKFSARAYSSTNSTWSMTSGTNKILNSLGRADLTSNLDTTKVLGTGYKTLTSGGEVEWAIIDVYSASFGGHRLYIDTREFNGTGVLPSQVNSIKLFDIYDGDITFVQSSGAWNIYRIVPNISSKILASTFQSYLRLQNGWYGTKAEFTFTQAILYKPHRLELLASSQADLNSLYNSVVTVSDVFLAFKELSSNGILGNESGLEFVNGIQFMNADVDGSGVFDESDTYKLLQHLTGIQPLTQRTALPDLLKLYTKSDYDAITKTNWASRSNNTSNLLPFTLSGFNNNYNVSATWIGDVNLSHSALATNAVAVNSTRSMSLTLANQVEASIITELVKDKVYAYVTMDPLKQELVGTQFELKYDNTVLKFEKVEFTTNGSPTNFGVNRGSYVNFGSLITDGSTILGSNTQYKITFSSLENISNVLGLMSIGNTDAVNKAGSQLKVILK